MNDSIDNNALFLNERTPHSPPYIKPVLDSICRPLWSVMIPTYNDLPQLRETIESVLIQNIAPERMQIAVIDDCSDIGDIKALVREIGGDRIEYFRQEKNVGSLRNFETCLNRATGEWIHILHGDDKIVLGFYEEIEYLFHNYPEAGAAFTNMAHTIADEDFLHIHPIFANETGIVENFLIQNAEKLLIQPPCIVVKRNVYEHLGGFYAVHYGEDWEMWSRIAKHYSIAYSPKCLAHYRYWNKDSITQKSIATGQNIRDIVKVIDIINTYLPLGQQKSIKKAARKHYALYCISLANLLYTTDRSSALKQAMGALELSKDTTIILAFSKYIVKSMKWYLGKTSG